MSYLWEEFLDFIEAHAWVRFAFFALLLVLFWGNWSVMGAIAAVWALHEILYRVRRAWKR